MEAGGSEIPKRSQVRPAQHNLIKTGLALAYIRKYIT